MSARKRETNETVGRTIVDRQRRFPETAESGEDIAKTFICRTIKLNLAPQRYSPELVRATRRKLGASQAIFTQFLGVSVSAAHDCEQGIKPPHGAACRLMHETRHDPKY